MSEKVLPKTLPGFMELLPNEQILFNEMMDKIKNQFKYANRLNIPYVIVIGEDEIKENKVSLKNMETGEQNTITIEETINIIK